MVWTTVTPSIPRFYTPPEPNSESHLKMPPDTKKTKHNFSVPAVRFWGCNFFQLYRTALKCVLQILINQSFKAGEWRQLGRLFRNRLAGSGWLIWLAGWLADLAGLAGWLIWLIWPGGWFWNPAIQEATKLSHQELWQKKCMAFIPQRLTKKSSPASQHQTSRI